MESVQGIIDGLKSATYEISALLLPGIVLIALAHSLVGGPDPGSIPIWIVAGYCVGLALQGIASWAVRTRGARWLVGGVNPGKTPVSPAQKLTRSIVAKDLGEDIAKDHLLDVALTRVHPNRHVYDKFLALADTTRALALVAVIAIGLAIYGMRYELETRAPWLVVAGAVVAWLGFIERHRKFSPLAYRALYGKFVAQHGRAPTADAPESTDPNVTG